jgi:peroxiredoxin Q/BCP
MITLNVGDKAPEFKALNQSNEPISLTDFRGKKVILYFYPKDNTPGCTAEACNLNDNYADLTDKGFEVIGVSPDSIESHQKFIAKFNLSFNLIADPDNEVINKYGVWGEKNMYGKKSMGLLRTTFIIDEEGKIEHIFKKVKTKDHTNQILEKL